MGGKLKIDLHIHTQKVKTGDPETRNITVDDFLVKTSEVDICSITNHNKFDIIEYNDILEKKDEHKLVWPGVELDIECNGEPTHMILVTDPLKAQVLNNYVSAIVTDVNNFKVNIDTLVNNLSDKFNKDEIILFVHYYKSPKVKEETFNKIVDVVKEKGFLIFAEPSNYVSTSILLNKKIRALNGSDIKDWNTYDSSKIQELKIPVDSFKSFYLLAKKDSSVISNHINQVDSRDYTVELGKGKNKDQVHIPIINEINVIFGGKGTGKSEIIESLYCKYGDEGKEVKKYSSQHNESDYSTLIKQLNEDCNKLNISSCNEELFHLINYKENIDITFMREVYKYAEYKLNSRKTDKYPIVHIQYPKVENTRLFSEKKEVMKELLEDVEGILNAEKLSVLAEQEQAKLVELLTKISMSTYDMELTALKETFVIKNSQQTISNSKAVLEKKKALISKPTTIGFSKFISERSNYTSKICKIISELDKNDENTELLLGKLPQKGEIKLHVTETLLNSALKNPSQKLGFTQVTKSKIVKEAVLKLIENKFEDISNVTQDIRDKFEEEVIEDISLSYLVGKSKSVQLNGDEYEPSKGEKAILLINHTLDKLDKDIYLFDEIETGFENSYITTIIIPKINKLIGLNKTIIIVTHNANIATHLYPFNTIYREYTGKKYKTYSGNMFNGMLRNIEDLNDTYQWLDKTLDVLEGQKEAFELRGDIYGI